MDELMVIAKCMACGRGFITEGKNQRDVYGVVIKNSRPKRYRTCGGTIVKIIPVPLKEWNNEPKN